MSEAYIPSNPDFTLNCIGLDSKVEISISTPPDILIEILTIFYNDGNNNNNGGYSFESPTNALWASYQATPAEIGTKRVRITGLDNLKTYIFYALLNYTENVDGLEIERRMWSVQTPDISLSQNPLPVILVSDYDGKDARDNEAYNCKVKYSEGFFNRGVQKLVFLLYNNDTDSTAINKVSQKEFDLPSDAQQLGYSLFRLTGLDTEKTYEVACLAVKNRQTTMSVVETNGVVSPITTIKISASRKPTPPYAAVRIFNYVTGNVSLSTYIDSPGSGDGYFSYTLRILETDDSSVSAGTEITTEVTGGDLYNFSLNTIDYSNIFKLAKTYKCIFLARNTISLNSVSNIFEINKFTIMPLKKAAAPVVEITELFEDRLTFNWSLPEMYNGDLVNYVLILKTQINGSVEKTYSIVNTDEIVSFTTPLGDLIKGTKYYAQVNARSNNSVNYNNSNEDQYIHGLTSPISDVWGTPSKKMSSPTLAVSSYAEIDVSKMVKLTISNYVNDSGLPFKRLEIVRMTSNTTDSANIISSYKDITDTTSLSNLQISNLTNGETHYFAVRGVVEISADTVSNPLLHEIVNGDVSAPVKFIPWDKPTKPTITVRGVGNHFVKVFLEDNNQPSITGVNNFIRYNLGTVGPNIDVYTILTNKVFYNLINGTQYTFPITAEYDDPNVLNYTISVTGDSVFATPVFTEEPFQPQNVGVSAEDNGNVTATWDPPSFEGADPDDNITLLNYSVFCYLDGVRLSSPFYTVDKTADLSQVISGLTLGTEYQIMIVANYQDDVDSPHVNSALSDTIIPYTQADAPTITDVIPGDTQLTVDFTHSVNTGGLDVQGIRIFRSESSDGFNSNYQDFMGTGLSEIVSNLTNGVSYYLSLATLTYVPYSNTILEGVVSEFTGPYFPRPDNFTNELSLYVLNNGFDLVDDVTVGKVELAWTLVSSDDLERIGFYYEIQQVTVSGNPIDGTVVTLDSQITSTIISNLPLGESSYFVVRLKVNDPNNPGNYIYGSYTNSVEVNPYDNTPGQVKGTDAQGLDQAIDVTWTPEETIGGANVVGYNIYQRLTTLNGSNAFSKVNSEPIATSPYTILNLVNGTRYDQFVTYVTENGDESSTDPTKVIIVAATPFTAPTSGVIVADIYDATSGRVVISLVDDSSANGSPITKYRLYQDDVNVAEQYSFPFTQNGLTNGQSYNFKVTALYSNLNNPSETLEGPSSNTVSKIPFCSDVPPVIDYVENMGNGVAVKVHYLFSADPSTGLLSSSQKLYLIVNNDSDNPILVSNSDVYHSLDLAPGVETSFEFISQFANPNDSSNLVNSTLSTSKSYIPFGIPSINGIGLGTIGDRTAQLKLYSSVLNTNGGAFQRYILRVLLSSDDSLVQGPFNLSDQTTLRTIRNLTNSVEYKIEVTVVVNGQIESGSLSHPNVEIQSVPIYTFITPTANNVPEIVSYNTSNDHRYMVFEIQSYFKDLSKLIVFVSPTFASYYLDAQIALYYEIGSFSDPDESGIVTVLVELTDARLTTNNIRSIAAIASNHLGMSETFFAPVKTANYFS